MVCNNRTIRFPTVMAMLRVTNVPIYLATVLFVGPTKESVLDCDDDDDGGGGSPGSVCEWGGTTTRTS
jgi:hypothetical protein